MTDRTWRQGYVPGKAKKTIHIDDEVARVLEIQAAEERVSQAEIVERALRKELGMMTPYNGWVINTGFLGGNILSGYDERPVDEAASCARYKDMLHEALEKEFPGADIRIHYEVMASGATPAPMRTYVRTPDGMEYYPGDDHEAGAMAARVNDICGEVWESWEWVVYEE